MTWNKFYLSDYQDIDGGFVAFGGSSKGGKITGKGKIRIGKLDFKDVYFVKELKFNLFFVSQMCDKKNSVLFTETECLVLSPDFKLLDESQVLLKLLDRTTIKLMSQNPESSEDKITDDAGKNNEVEDPAKKDDINGPGEATNTNSTNRLNTVSLPINTVSSSFTTVDPGRARDQRNEFESVFGQDKDANSTYRMFTHVSAVESSYENLGGSTHVIATTPSNADYLTESFDADLEIH
ncbi:hypothetical protein Tco_0702046 [Tanacetum coccineum]|uniref:Retrovirus-related Pol polyprotein from transposon TNT 1-94-like beta-barrel domain-containing protein n=1 Tax=Tanacetum coccineum TaxID=301880 RepID=A0ABQ4XWI6_9ASTR